MFLAYQGDMKRRVVAAIVALLFPTSALLYLGRPGVAVLSCVCLPILHVGVSAAYALGVLPGAWYFAALVAVLLGDRLAFLL